MADSESAEKKDVVRLAVAAPENGAIPLQTETERARAACVENAEALLTAATVVAAQPGSNHIAYHLAALALEEIGKSSMIFMSSLRTPGDEERKRPIDWIEDHGSDAMSPERVTSTRMIVRIGQNLRSGS